MRAAIRWYGGKWRLATKIIPFIMWTPHHHYVEVFGGGAGVLLRKPRSEVETYNDLDGQIVNYFRCLREDPERLINLISLTPFSLEEYELALTDPTPADPYERARRFYTKAQQGRGGGSAKYRSGWRRYKTPAGNTPPAVTWDRVEHLFRVAKRFKQVQIEQSPALELIERYDRPDTLFYLDPPYPPECRSRQWGNRGYAHEMTHKDHYDLGQLVHEIKGHTIISCRHCPQYDEMYNDWRHIDLSAYEDCNQPVTEVLWFSPGVVLEAPTLQGRLL